MAMYSKFWDEDGKVYWVMDGDEKLFSMPDDDVLVDRVVYSLSIARRYFVLADRLDSAARQARRGGGKMLTKRSDEELGIVAEPSKDPPKKISYELEEIYVATMRLQKMIKDVVSKTND